MCINFHVVHVHLHITISSLLSTANLLNERRTNLMTILKGDAIQHCSLLLTFSLTTLLFPLSCLVYDDFFLFSSLRSLECLAIFVAGCEEWREEGGGGECCRFLSEWS